MNMYEAPMLDKPIFYTEDNDILFAAPPKPRPTTVDADYDAPVLIECPVCGAQQEDFDGFGVVHCDACGYCTHISSTGGVCDICGKRTAKQILCTGHMAPGDVAPVITVRLPVSLTPAAFVAYMREALPSIIVVDDVDSMSEGDFLEFRLNALRAGTVQPIARPLTDDATEAIEREWIGREQHDCRGEW